MRPSVCFFENVEGHISLGLPDVIEDLAGLGYRTTWCVASASEVGAPHQRKRVFILAYDQSLGIQGRWPSWIEESRPHAGQALPVRGGDAGGEQWPSRPGCEQQWWELPRVVVDNAAHTNRRSRVSAEEAGAGPDDIWRRRSGESGERATFASLGRDLDGALPWARLSELSGLSDQELAEIRHWMVASDNRTDELRLLGNGVVPATAERAFRALVGELIQHASP